MKTKLSLQKYGEIQNLHQDIINQFPDLMYHHLNFQQCQDILHQAKIWRKNTIAAKKQSDNSYQPVLYLKDEVRNECANFTFFNLDLNDLIKLSILNYNYATYQQIKKVM